MSVHGRKFGITDLNVEFIRFGKYKITQWLRDFGLRVIQARIEGGWNMAIRPLPGAFYEFHRARVTSKAGQPIDTKEGVEISPMIPRELAAQQVKMGKDVYTLLKSDAERLVKHLYPTRPVCEPAHQPMYYPHFHPAGEHGIFDEARQGRPKAVTGPGHVFFGERGGK